MKIAIVSTRGIPNNYGGFEQFAEHISVELTGRGHTVTVYNPHFHFYEKPGFNGVNIVKIFSPEKQLKTAANFIYDFLSLKHAIAGKHDVILCCGYTTSAVSYYLLDIKQTVLITNLDGLEWKRSKYSKPIQRLAKWFEKIAVKKSHFLVADNTGIASYLEETYNAPSEFIPYGATVVTDFDESILKNFTVTSHEYDVLIARMEPENNIETILDAYKELESRQILVVGSTSNSYGKKISHLYSQFKNIRFLNWISDKNTLDALRHYSRLYIHGHSVGGTNPSLLEAMAAQSCIVAHTNKFNRSVLGNDALYFGSANDLKNIVKSYSAETENRQCKISNNMEKIRNFYSWEKITDSYEDLFKKAVSGRQAN